MTEKISGIFNGLAFSEINFAEYKIESDPNIKRPYLFHDTEDCTKFYICHLDDADQVISVIFGHHSQYHQGD